ncbi:MAG: uroporphyrinogen decarboxylase family protein, partial [Saprospiraceae bacterium]
MNLQNDLLLRAAKGETTERPPVWLMRQAGRILPQYRAIRERLSDFKELVKTPELAAEVTIQPVDELGVDA